MSPAAPVRAAGAVPVRVHDRVLQVLLVHRAKYDDWSWPKGKLDHGEDFVSAAVRETAEETGLQVRVGRPLPQVTYRMGTGQTKLVRYWAAEVVGGDGKLEHEVDRVDWLSPTLAARRLTYPHDRALLDEVVRMHASGELATWPLLLVRHAQSVSRDEWGGTDPERPLSEAGRRRAEGRMTAVLQAYGPRRLLTSPSVRCVDSLAPYAEATGLPLKHKKGLSEEGFTARPEKAVKHLRKLCDAGEPAALCTHRPVLPPLAAHLVERAADDLDPAELRMLRRLTEVVLDKGEILALTMLGTGEDARVVAADRHRPSS